MAYHRTGTDGNVLVDYAIISDLASLAYHGSAADRDLAADLGTAGNMAAPGTMAAIQFTLVRNILEKLGNGVVGILDTDQRRGHRLLGNEIGIHQQYTRAAGVNILFIFGIGVEAECSGPPMFNFCKACNSNFGITLDGTPKYLC